MVFTFMSLWSYESQLVIILIAPVSLLVRFGIARRKLILIGIYYIVPTIYVLKSAVRYLHSSGGTYQESVLRNDLGVFSLWRDLWFNIGASLKFWGWAGPIPRYAEQQSLLFSCATSALFVIGALALKRYLKAEEQLFSLPFAICR
jgi:hypothetical protein